MLGIVALLAAFALLFAGLAFSRLWNFGDRGGRDLCVGAVLALLVLAPYGTAAYWATISPPLRDISTDFDDPPVIDTSDRTEDMNVLSTPTPGRAKPAGETYPLVTGRSYNLPFERSWKRSRPCSTVATGSFSAVSLTDGQSEVTINALAKSFVLGLPADVAIRVTDDGETVIVDMRSASRYGRYDLGDNAARIVDFLAELDQEVAGQVGAAPAE